MFSFDDQANNKDQLDEPKEEPLGFLNTEEETDVGIEGEDFELIQSTEVPSVEEAERQLEIVRLETERRQKEEETLDEEERVNDGQEEVTDGAAC